MITNLNIDKIFKILKKAVKDFPEPAIEKISHYHDSPFHILIATILSARTKDETTLNVSNILFRKIKNLDGLLKINVKTLQKIIYPVGFYRAKSRNLKKTALILREKFNDKVPDELKHLLLLPGVGRKTANLVIIRAFNKYGICVDTHVHRITNRWKYVHTRVPDETEQVLRRKLPKHLWKIINNILVTYGKVICKPIRPLCHQCSIAYACPYSKKGKIIKF